MGWHLGVGVWLGKCWSQVDLSPLGHWGPWSSCCLTCSQLPPRPGGPLRDGPAFGFVPYIRSSSAIRAGFSSSPRTAPCTACVGKSAAPVKSPFLSRGLFEQPCCLGHCWESQHQPTLMASGPKRVCLKIPVPNNLYSYSHESPRGPLRLFSPLQKTKMTLKDISLLPHV